MQSAASLYNLSLDYLGYGGHPRDDRKAFILNRKAAELGDKDAILAMGWFFLNGYGVDKDIKEAQRWYRKAARVGNTSAMFSMGEISYMQESFTDARKWFMSAARRGHARSFYWLGKLHFRNQITGSNRAEAYAMFHKAAHMHNREAIRALRFLSRRK